MRALGAVVAAGVVAWVATPAAAAPPRVRSLPWPPTVLPRTPPLAPPTSGVLPLSPLLARQIETRERIVVGVDDSGRPHSVRVLQRIVIKRLADYVFAIPAPVRSVMPGPGTESVPGQRENQILWEGFSPGRRVLAAWADLRVAESARALPARVEVETTIDGERLAPGERRSGALKTTLTITNATVVDAESYEAEPEPVGLAQVIDRIRAAIRDGVFAEGVNVGLFGGMTPVKQRVAAPLRVEGTLTFGSGTVTIPGARDGVVRFKQRLDGLNRTTLRIDLRGRATNAVAPKLDLRVSTADADDPVNPPGGKSWMSALRRHELGDPRRLLQRTIALELTYARKRQYDMFLASPDPSGPGSAIYVYRTAVPSHASSASARGGGANHTIGWIGLAVVLAAVVPSAAVIWAHS